MNKTIFFFAGELSGDLHGARLLQKIKNFRCIGVGGPRMRSENFQCIVPMEEFQVMGFTDVILNLPRLFKLFFKIRNIILSQNPEGVVLIDYPGFNIRMAQSLRKKGYQGKIIQYIAPSVWAWKHKRVYKMAKSLDVLLTIFPFESEYFSQTTLPVPYVGNPLVHTINQYEYDEDWRKRYNLPAHNKILSIFPGSRASEIEQNLHRQIIAALKFIEHNPSYKLAISLADEKLRVNIEQKLKALKIKAPIVTANDHYELMNSSSMSIASSGTVSLELALHRTPTVITYSMTPLNWLVAKYLFRIDLPFYCIVNITCEYEVFPEAIGLNISSEEIFKKLIYLKQNHTRCQEGCDKLKTILGEDNSSEKASKIIQGLIC